MYKSTCLCRLKFIKSDFWTWSHHHQLFSRNIQHNLPRVRIWHLCHSFVMHGYIKHLHEIDWYLIIMQLFNSKKNWVSINAKSSLRNEAQVHNNKPLNYRFANALTFLCCEGLRANWHTFTFLVPDIVKTILN